MNFSSPDHGAALDPAPARHERGEQASPLLVFSIVRRRKFSILLVAALLSGLVIAGVAQLKPSFVASSSVLMQEHRPVIADISSMSGPSATDSVAVRTQADILRSADLARSVVRRLDLLDRPEFAVTTSPGLLARLLGPLAERLRPLDRNGLIDRLGLFTPPAPPAPAEREEIAVQRLLGMTSIVNDGRSYVIDIKVKVTATASGEAARAAALSAELANAYADAYTQFTGDVKSDSIRHANGFVEQRIAALQQKTTAAEQAVQTYRAANGLVEDRAASSDGRSVTIAAQQMAQLNGDLTAAISDRANKEASLQQITLARSGRGDLESVAEVIASPMIQRLREQQAELGAREAALATSQGAGSPTLIAVRGSQRDVAAQLAAETAKIAASLRGGVEAAQAREAGLRARLAQLQNEVGAQGSTEIKLRELENQADIARTIYATYLKRSEETANQIDMQEPDALVVSRAGIPLGAAPPSPKQLDAAGIVVSLFLSVLLALIRERAQSGFRTSEQFESSTGIETLGFLPKVKDTRAALRLADRRSPFPHAIASVRAMLRLNMHRGAKVVMVTSALPQEGKTFFAAAFARSAALAGERVLLVDCDLRRPAVARDIGTTEVDAFQGVAIRRDAHSSLDTITLTTTGGSPQDLFASGQMRNLMELLRERYDLIMLDAPPVLAVSDARVLSTLSDMVVLVVCWQKTPQQLVNNAVRALRNVGAKLAGAVITQVRLNELSPADGGYAYASPRHAKVLLR